MNHAVIFANPKPSSFTSAMANAYRQAALAKDHQVEMRDLYRENFDPCLQEDELPWADDFRTHADVAHERLLLSETGVFAFFYPLWLNAPPAMLKGYLERVFGMGFAYKRGHGGNEPLLSGRKLISFSSSGAPMDWVVRTGAWQAVRTLFDSHFASVCGMEVVDHIHFGGIVPGIRPDAVDRNVEIVRQKVAEHF